MSYHHAFSPSSLGRRRLCPGSFQIELGAPKSTNEYAAAVEGTFMHEQIAQAIEVSQTEGRIVAMEGLLKMNLNTEQMNVIGDCLSWFDDLTEQYCTDAFSKYKAPKVEVERTVAWTEGGSVITAGTADVVVYPQVASTVIDSDVPVALEEGEDRGVDMPAVIIDWKFGRAQVDATNIQMQMMAYALLLFKSHDKLTSVSCHIYQPRVGGEYTAHYDRVNVPRMEEEIEATIDACKVVDPVISPSHSACAYCTGLPVCPKVQSMAGRSLEQVTAQGLPSCPEEAISALVDTYTPEQMGDLVGKAKVVEAYVKKVKEIAREKLKDDDQAVEGWKLQKRRGRKSITDNRHAAEIITEKLDHMIEADILKHGTVKLKDLGDLLLQQEINIVHLLRVAKLNYNGIQKDFASVESCSMGESIASAKKKFDEALSEVTSESDPVYAVIKDKEANNG